MAYASVDDMISRFGEPELARATTPENVDVTGVDAEKVQTALDDASAIIDSFLRRRYHVPLEAVPPEINRACCMLARVDLGMGGEKSISDQAQKAADTATAWLKQLANGTADLGMEEVTVGEESFATASGRRPVFGGEAGCEDGDREAFGFWAGGEP